MDSFHEGVRPPDTFTFPWKDIEVRQLVPSDLTFGSFASVRYLCDGSNSNIYTATWYGKNVIIKVIKREVMEVPIVKSEFQIEIEILTRLKHPNIINIIGWGIQKGRIFIVLEPLDEVGSNLNGNKPYKNKDLIFQRALKLGFELANAISYLHQNVHPNAMIIHRDLKLENIGIGSDGSLKLFDFGLARCIQRNETGEDIYEMTGGTGTLRFMAPEVALYKPYNEKADVFSFGILFWAMITSKTPFKGFDRYMHFEKVVIEGERPPIDESWPEWLRNLLKVTWASDATLRPSMSQVLDMMETYVLKADATNVATSSSDGAQNSSCLRCFRRPEERNIRPVT